MLLELIGFAIMAVISILGIRWAYGKFDGVLQDASNKLYELLRSDDIALDQYESVGPLRQWLALLRFKARGPLWPWAMLCLFSWVGLIVALWRINELLPPIDTLQSEQLVSALAHVMAGV